jgi:kynurenine formamidase
MLLATPCLATAQPVDLGTAEVIDLSHSFDESTIYWPTSPSTFELDRLSFGQTPGGWFYSANALCTPEHGGTHLDAPIHFAAGAQSADQLDLRKMIAPAVVIDVAARAEAEADYRLTVDDVRAWEARHGEIPAGAIVLLRTGWSARWPDRKRYLGDDTPGDASKLHFPAFGADAAKLLIEERRIAALGLDTASLDPGNSRDFPVHRLAGAANVPGFENLTSLERLPPTGAWVVALPMKIKGGSGGPLRAVALVPGGGTPSPSGRGPG